MHLQNRTLFLNLLIGVALLSIPVLTSPDFGGDVSLFQVVGFRNSFMAYALLVLFFFANYYVFIPNYYAQKKWVLYGVILLGCYAAIFYLPTWVVNAPAPSMDPRKGPFPEFGMPEKRPPFDLFQFRDTFVFQFLMVLGLSLLLKLDDQLKAIKSEMLRTEVSYLKAQINPHFLFNTLNNIYALSLTKSDKAPQAVLKLSDMMRYVVTESDHESVPLEREIAYISDYIALQQLRMGKEVDFRFEVKGDPIGRHIAPIILINYVENAFKYGVNPDAPSKIHIFMTIDDLGIFLEVENRKSVDKKALPPNTEEGARNTQQRLEYLYPSKYKLEVHETKEIYSVKLFIELE